LPKYVKSYPIKKKELSKAIIENKKNLKKIINIVHPIVNKRMKNFLKKNVKSKMVILDIPLLIENKINDKNFILIFVDAKRQKINKRLKKRTNYNNKITDNFRKLQKPLTLKKNLSDYIIKNNFKFSTVKKNVKLIKYQILNERNST
jgi:dephospho-CoA kinase